MNAQQDIGTNYCFNIGPIPLTPVFTKKNENPQNYKHSLKGANWTVRVLIGNAQSNLIF